MTSTAIILLGLFAFATIITIVILFINAEKQRQLAEYREKTIGSLMPSRMQAYERITLYLERINPMNMVIREQFNVNTSQELHTLMITSIYYVVNTSDIKSNVFLSFFLQSKLR